MSPEEFEITLLLLYPGFKKLGPETVRVITGKLGVGWVYFNNKYIIKLNSDSYIMIYNSSRTNWIKEPDFERVLERLDKIL